jgi:hypothetical protein
MHLKLQLQLKLQLLMMLYEVMAEQEVGGR